MARTTGTDRATRSLPAVLDRLAQVYFAETPRADALALVLHENVGYLIDDARREELFREFERRVGVDAARISRAPDAVLLDIARRGGMRPELRVERWRRIAEIVLSDCGGDLDVHLGKLPLAKARALLKRFPAIGDPGADKILLFCGLDACPALESNGLRVLVRLGFMKPGTSYAASYRAATCLAGAFSRDRDRLIATYTLLRAHGRTLCRRNAPRCMACPLDALCAHAPAKGL